MREQLKTVGHNVNGKHLSIPKRLKDSGAWRWDFKQFLLRSVLLLTSWYTNVEYISWILLYCTVLHIICNSVCSICSNMVTINIMWLERKWAGSPITIGAARKQKARQNAMAELRTGYSWETNLTFVKKKNKKIIIKNNNNKKNHPTKQKKYQVSSSCGIRTLIFGHHSIMGCMKAVVSSIMMQDNPFSVVTQWCENHH